MADEKGFVIKDKRILAEGDETGEKETVSESVEGKPEIKQSVADQQRSEDDFEYPPINFTNFVLSLHTSALFHFGDIPDPTSGKAQKSLPAVKQTIDMLDMINEKTKGNLNEQENNLLQGVLYELKMRFVKENG